MKITSLKVGKIKSFGPEQTFENFSSFNLFIGKNGTGKTNALKLLCGLPVEFKKIDNHPGAYFPFNMIDISDYSKYNEMEGFGGVIYNFEIDEKAIELRYENSYQYTNRIITGDVNLMGKVNIINPNITSLKELILDLRLFCSNNRSNIPLLSFGISYILEMDFSIQFNDDFKIEITTGNETFGYQIDQIESFSSGQLFCISCVIKIISTINSLILIDEPEGTLEPRAIRRLFHFMAWLVFKNNANKSKYENLLENSIKQDLNKWWEKIQLRFNDRFPHKNESFPFPFYNQMVCWDDFNGPKVSIENTSLGQSQIFIASHAPILINEFLKFHNKASIYEFRNGLHRSEIDIYKDVRDLLDESLLKNPIRIRLKNCTLVNKINSDFYSLLDELGCKGSDLLQTNGVIWVEGPSDIVFISKWLEMYANENNLQAIMQGKDFEFQMFGGTLLDSICLFKESDKPENEFHKIVQMFSFSRNAYIIIDSDAVIKDQLLLDKSRFSVAKTYIKNQFKSLKRENLGMWYAEGNTELKTIEDYLDETSKKMLGIPKKKCAIKLIESWGENKKLSEFDNSLKEEIEKLYQCISLWNN